MADVDAAHNQLITCLEAITAGNDHLTVCDGDVPDGLPAEPRTNRVYPYFAVWASVGAPPGERAVADVVTGPLRWPVQITVAAGVPAWVMGATAALREGLAQLVLPGGALLLEDVEGAVPIQIDRDESPPRWFVPTRWSALLP